MVGAVTSTTSSLVVASVPALPTASRLPLPCRDEAAVLQSLLAELGPQHVVVTGFIAADEAGHTLLLGRNGSDYSATLLGALADADATTIWSDVAGVYSADPRIESAGLVTLADPEGRDQHEHDRRVGAATQRAQQRRAVS